MFFVLVLGVHYPSLASLCSQKVVESERGFLMSTVSSGSYLGWVDSRSINGEWWQRNECFWFSEKITVVKCKKERGLFRNCGYWVPIFTLNTFLVFKISESFFVTAWYLIVFKACITPIMCLILLWWNILVFFFRTVVIGGVGSLMLDLYGWESVFYLSGLLSVLWAYCMWKYLLKGEGKCGNYATQSHKLLLNRES